MINRLHSQNLSTSISRNNFRAFIWHASFLAIAKNFMDVDTVIPSMLIKAGGEPWHIGLLTTIMVGFSKFSQLLFAPMISGSAAKKPHLLTGINLRIFALFSMAALFYLYMFMSSTMAILLIFGLVSIFSVSGAYANIAFTDILGKSVKEERRKQFFSLKQVISSLGMFGSAIAVSYVLKQNEWPDNYFWVFILAGGFLLLASLGFWRISEVISPNEKTKKYRFAHLWSELKRDRKLLFFLLSINVLGLGQGLMPFLLLFAGEKELATSGLVGNLLIAKTLGLIVSGLILYKRAKKFSYRSMLWFLWGLAVIYPAAAWIFSSNVWFYYISFFMGGVFLTLYQIANSGVLLEISTTQNRALYTGIAGAGNILPVLFPLLGGSLIALIGFNAFFGLYTGIAALGVWFLHKMDCQK
ncbi:MFS transporter [Salinivirga cyanobacteriivorans]